MDIDWLKVEECLFDISSADIKEFSEKHGDECFYGFAFDCNSEYGNVLLCLNTTDDLKKTAKQYAKNSPNKEVFEQIDQGLNESIGGEECSELTPDPPESYEIPLKWSLGDWKYQGFNSERFDAEWDSFESQILEACMDEDEDEETYRTPTQHRMMQVVCRVLVRMESSGVFEVLNKTPDFKTFVADHDEDESDSWERLNEIKAQ